MLTASIVELVLLLLSLTLFIIFLVALTSFHKKNKTEIRVIRQRLRLGETTAQHKKGA